MKMELSELNEMMMLFLVQNARDILQGLIAPPMSSKSITVGEVGNVVQGYSFAQFVESEQQYPHLRRKWNEDETMKYIVSALSFTLEMILMFIFVIALPVATWWLMILLLAR